jgi:hypothetical protein
MGLNACAANALVQAQRRKASFMFEALEEVPPHPLSELYGAFAQDRNPDKIDLGIGIYRDDHGRCPIMPRRS